MEKVKTAANLIEQLEKIDAFMKEAPSDSHILTITFRNHKNQSKSMSLHDDMDTIDMRKMLHDMRNKTAQRIIALGIELN